MVAEQTKYFDDDLRTAHNLEALSRCKSNILYPCFSPSRTEVAETRRDTWCHMRNSGFQTFQAPDLDQGAVGAVCGVAVQVPRRILRRILMIPVNNDGLWRLMGIMVMLVTSRASLASSWTKH